MGAGAARVGRGARRVSGEVGRIDDDEIGRFVDQSGGAAALRIERVGDDDFGAPNQAVERRVFLGQRREQRVDFDQRAGRRRPTLQQRQTDRADPGADVDEPGDRRSRRCGEQDRVEPDAMTVARLSQPQSAVEDRVEAGRIGLSHR